MGKKVKGRVRRGAKKGEQRQGRISEPLSLAICATAAAMLPPAPSPPTLTSEGSLPMDVAVLMVHERASYASSMAAGNAWSGASR